MLQPQSHVVHPEPPAPLPLLGSWPSMSICSFAATIVLTQHVCMERAGEPDCLPAGPPAFFPPSPNPLFSFFDSIGDRTRACVCQANGVL